MIEPEIATDTVNCWLMTENDEAVEDERLRKYLVVLNGSPNLFEGIEEGDKVIVSRPTGEVTRIGRILRIRSTLTETTVYFDRVAQLEDRPALTTVGLSVPNSSISRLQTDAFNTAAPKLYGKALGSIPLIDDQTYIRELLQFAVTDDLLGPAGGPHEHVVDMSVRDRYLVGKLAPRKPAKDGDPAAAGGSKSEPVEEPAEEVKAGVYQPGAEFPSTTGRVDPEDDPSEEVDAATNQSLIPSSFGMTFCVDGEVDEITISISWGQYQRIPADSHDYTKTVNKKIRDSDGRVIREEQEEVKVKAWERIPRGGSISLKLEDGIIGKLNPDKEYSDVFIRGTVRSKNQKGERLITLFLVNDQLEPETNIDTAWLFQPEILVTSKDGDKPIFKRRPALDVDGEDPEREMLEMIYRDHVEFAVGHGISVHAEPSSGDPARATEIRSRVIPFHEVPFTDIPGKAPGDRKVLKDLEEKRVLDMTSLATMSKDDLIETLATLQKDYVAWLSEQRGRIGTEVIGYDASAREALNRCDEVSKRLQVGIETLRSDEAALKAFRLANEAMALQRVHSLYALSKRRNEGKSLESFDIPKNRSWRPFQLAFILLSLPALTDPGCNDRTSSVDGIADLLWFPTGGGKTEAYLGVAAFTMIIRRLKPDLGGYDGTRGLAVLMRYTLRLLTLQQFQRATTLICALETLRRKGADGGDSSLGKHPFTMGLWVGNKVTPGTTKVSKKAIDLLRNKERGRSVGATPLQLTSCPWCGAKILPGRDVTVHLDTTLSLGRTLVFCSDDVDNCPFSRVKSDAQPHPGIPVLVVDDEIYARPPTMMIATVDKFAMMAWRGQAKTLFGIATQECDRHGLIVPDTGCTGNHNAGNGQPRVTVKAIRKIRPPDLIIQDEFHLISGPLGTMVGLYETAIDELCSWQLGNKTVRPKIIASTATVRKARAQVHNVFMRKVNIFPPNGLDIEDNYFSIQRTPEYRSGRKYMGVCSPGSSRPAVLIRTYVAFLSAAQSLFDSFGLPADPYMTMVGYFNSLRELGGMKRLAEDDVRTRTYRVRMSLVDRPGLAQRSVVDPKELTSRISSQDIPKTLDALEVPFKAEFDRSLGKFVSNWQKGDQRAIDVVLASNMLSVGVDINRLGVMVVNGQPKGTAEYIQSTSRVGRQSPGLVCSVLTWARPRDLSHYETYEHYHATFYKHVEAQSVTPFSPRALDRGLTGTLVSLMRLKNDAYSPNHGAKTLLRSDAQEMDDALRRLVKRAQNVHSTETGALAERGLKARADDWASEAVVGGRTLAYQKDGPTAYSLLETPGLRPWSIWTTPMSMREVEPGVRLIMDAANLKDGPEWQARPKGTQSEGD